MRIWVRERISLSQCKKKKKCHYLLHFHYAKSNASCDVGVKCEHVLLQDSPICSFFH